MFNLIMILICVLNIPNIGNRYSNVLILILGLLGLLLLVAIKMYKSKDKSLLKVLVTDFKKFYGITIIQCCILLASCSQFVYSDWNNLNSEAIDNYYILNNPELERFLAHNSIIIPKCFKQMFLILGEVSRMSEMSQSDAIDRYTEVADIYNNLIGETSNGFNYLLFCIISFIICAIIRRLLISVEAIIADIKFIQENKKSET